MIALIFDLLFVTGSIPVLEKKETIHKIIGFTQRDKQRHKYKQKTIRRKEYE